MSRFGKLIATGLGTGYLPVAPGTWASLVPCAIFLALGFASGSSLASQLIVAVVMTMLALLCSIACIALGPSVERTFGRTDPRQCVIDEWAGQAVALIMLPIGVGASMLKIAATAFVLFRIADIIKPPPGRRWEKLPFGWGVLMDDIVAGVYANVAAQFILRVGLKQ